MQLSATQFEERCRSGRLTLTLIGMSNVGKSYWSCALEDTGWHRIWADGRLHHRLQRDGILQDATDVGLARWLGMPYEERFGEREQRLLNVEAELFWEIARECEAGELGNTVVDPGGSFIYAGAALCEAFRKHSLMVYLETTHAMRREMFDRFLQHPKALLWHGEFRQAPGETERAALARCYPKLLKERSDTYARYADVTIPFQSLPRNGDGTQFLACLRARL